MKKKKIYKLVVVLIIAIIIGMSSVYVIKEKGKIPKEEKTKQALAKENVNNEEEKKALTVNPDTWDSTKVTAVISKDGKTVPVPVGFTPSKAEGEQEVDKGFVIYEGEVTAADPNAWTEEEAWTASINQNQFVWVPVANASSRIYERNATTGKLKARLWDYNASGRSVYSNSRNTDTKYEAGVLSGQSYDGINYMSDPDYGSMPGYSKDSLYKELETEFKKTMESIEKYVTAQ